MDSVASRRNDSPFRTSNSYVSPRRVDNSLRRQSSAISGSGFSSGFTSQRIPYCTRQNLSRSYDSPEGIRRMSQVSVRKASSSFHRAASPPAYLCSPKKQHNSAIGRNQTILDDAAWMSERILNLRRTGFVRYPSISKLRDPVVNQADEPLSAFRLSEVTLSEEDLLTDIACSREFSTCTSTPNLLQSSGNFERSVSEFYQGSPLSQEICNDHQKYMKQTRVSPNPNDIVDNPHSAATSESASANVRGDLLLRLEALQHRAELAAKGGNDSFSSNSNANQGNLNSKLFGSGQISCWDQTSSQKWNTFSQQSYAASSASPTHSTLSIESVSWPEEPGSSFDSTCWLKDIRQEAKAEPSASQLNHSLSRTIRPEYYLPLSKEEEPIFEAGVSPFRSPKGVKKMELRNDSRILALSVCQQRSEEVRPGKSMNNHKQRSLSQKSKRVLQSSMDSANGSGFVKAGGLPAASSPKPSPRVTRRTLLTEARPSHNHLCAEYKDTTHLIQEQTESINQSFSMKAPASEMDGQTRNSLENRFEYDGESSWISEENVEGFLCSRSFKLDEVDALSTSNEWSSPFLGTNLMHSTAKTTSSFLSEGPSRNKNIEELRMKDSGKGLFSSSQTQTACFNEEAIEGMAGICTFDCCKKAQLSPQNSLITTIQTDTCLQLLKEGSLTDLCQAANLSHESACQITHTEDESLNDNLIAHCKDTCGNEQLSNESQCGPGVKEQIMGKGDSSSWNIVSQKDLTIVSEESLENNMTVEAEKKLESTSIGQCHSARYSSHSSNPLASEQQVSLSSDALSSPATLPGEDRYWPATANRSKNTMHISKMHKSFAKIVRSLSFGERGHSEFKLNPKIQTNRDPSDTKSTGFGHYCIPSSASCSTSFDLENNVGNYSVKMQQMNVQITKEHPQDTPLQHGIGDRDRGPGGNRANLILLDSSCTTNSHIEQPAEEPCVMAHTVLLSKCESDADLHSCCEAPLSSKRFSQQCHELQLDSPIEIHCHVQDESQIGRVEEDIKNWNEECHQQSGESFTVEESLCTKTLQIEQEEVEPEINLENVILSEDKMVISSLANQNKGLMLEGVNKGEMVPKFSCTSGPESGSRGQTLCGRGESPSLLSIYKNPLWRDEVNGDVENGHRTQNQELQDPSYSDEGNFLDSDKNRINLSKRSHGAVWDTYEGMGGFLNSVPNSPSCATKQASEANHILVGFDAVINSSESNSFAIDSAWDLNGSLKKLRKIGEEASEVPGLSTQSRLSYHNQFEHCQQSAQSLMTMESQTINHDALSLSPDALSQLERNITFERNSNSDSTRISDGTENCLREQSVRSYVISSHSTKLIDSNNKHWDAANESTVNHFFLNSEPKCNAWKNIALVTEMSCETDKARGGRKAFDQLDRSGSKTGRELTVQNFGDPINLETMSASPCADGKLQIDRLCEQFDKECAQLVQHKPSSAKVDAPGENHFIEDLVMDSNDETEAGEEVKQVTFIYSDPKEPQKDLQAVEASIPEVPLDLLSTWILSFFTHASKGRVSMKRKEQKQLLIQDKAREDQAELKRIGRKVQALEAEIVRFKQENRKLQSLVKCMVRKVKQLQQGLRGRKKNGSSRGFSTCIYLVHIKRNSKSKFSRKF